MIKPKKAHHKTKNHIAGVFVLLAGFFVALFAAAVLLASPDRVLAQQPAQTIAQHTLNLI